jgi:hypothetical protein
MDTETQRHGEGLRISFSVSLCLCVKIYSSLFRYSATNSEGL